MNIAIYGTQINKGFETSIFELFQKLKEFKAQIFVYQPFYQCLIDEIYYEPKVSGLFSSYEELITCSPNFLFSFGGDGTFLKTITFVRDSNIPIVGFNSGRLGFLADLSRGKIAQAIEMIFEKKFSIEKRSLIQLKTPTGLFGDTNYALNELTVHKKDSSSMITIHAYIDNVFLNSYWADGLIIATPTGSTAYSLSAGGPIIVPTLSCFIITPLAPHNLTVRPIVIADNTDITLKVEGRNVNYLISLDSRYEVFDSALEINIKKADFTINVLKMENENFFSTLRSKLMWGADKRN